MAAELRRLQNSVKFFTAEFFNKFDGGEILKYAFKTKTL